MGITFAILACMLTPAAIRMIKDEEKRPVYPRRRHGREFI